MRRKGSVAQLIRKPRPGYILGEDGCLVAFDESVCFRQACVIATQLRPIQALAPQHRLYLLPLPQGQGELRPGVYAETLCSRATAPSGLR